MIYLLVIYFLYSLENKGKSVKMIFQITANLLMKVIEITFYSNFPVNIFVDTQLIIPWSDPEKVSIDIIAKACVVQLSLEILLEDMRGTDHPYPTYVLFWTIHHILRCVTSRQYKYHITREELILVDAHCRRIDAFLHDLWQLQH